MGKKRKGRRATLEKTYEDEECLVDLVNPLAELLKLLVLHCVPPHGCPQQVHVQVIRLREAREREREREKKKKVSRMDTEGQKDEPPRVTEVLRKSSQGGK